jgi:8-oxo-dGTP pyrophosphatase MutT (NUDIX family)
VLNILQIDWENIYTIRKTGNKYAIKANSEHSISVPKLSIDTVNPVLVCITDTIRDIPCNTPLDLSVKSALDNSYEDKYICFVDMSRINEKFTYKHGKVYCNTTIDQKNCWWMPVNRLNSIDVYCCGVIVVNDKSEKEVILVKNFAGNYSFPKGKRKEGEFAIETAIREMYEETGLTVCDVEIDLNVVREEPLTNHPEIQYFPAILKIEKPELKYDHREIESSEWYLFKESRLKFRGKRLKLWEEYLDKIEQ